MLAGMPPHLAELALPRPRVAELLGTWHIIRTNFPMRLGRNTSPRLEYGALPGRGDRMSDRVTYLRNDAPRQILGVDTQDPELPCHFTWRGRGLLALLRSEWYVVDLDPSGVAAIFFTRTLFTPVGLDIVSREAKPDPATVEACVERLRAASAFARVSGLANLSKIEQLTGPR